MNDLRTLDVTGLPDNVVEELERVLRALRRDMANIPPTQMPTVNGMPIEVWKREFQSWSGRIRGKPVMTDLPALPDHVQTAQPQTPAPTEKPGEASTEEWLKRFDVWADRPRPATPAFVDDSRESMYD